MTTDENFAFPVPPAFTAALERVRDQYLEELPPDDALSLAEAWSSGVPMWETKLENGVLWVVVKVTTAEGVHEVFDVRLDALGFDCVDGRLAPRATS